jgi:hypothetical protein
VDSSMQRRRAASPPLALASHCPKHGFMHASIAEVSSA